MNIKQNQVKQARELLNMTQLDLALLLGWSNSRHISNIETNKRPLSIQTALAIECLLRREKKFKLFAEKTCNQ